MKIQQGTSPGSKQTCRDWDDSQFPKAREYKQQEPTRSINKKKRDQIAITIERIQTKSKPVSKKPPNTAFNVLRSYLHTQFQAVADREFPNALRYTLAISTRLLQAQATRRRRLSRSPVIGGRSPTVLLGSV